MDADATLTVVYTGEPDEVFDFVDEGAARIFGRDDQICDIVVWAAINSKDLSRVAGRIWRMDGELWLRNLSAQHELEILVPGQPPEPPLRPRRSDGFDPGPARSIPGEIAFVQGPDGCELLVRQSRAAFQHVDPSEGEMTTRVPAVPAELKAIAAALCEPLLSGGRLPAAYSEVARRAGVDSLKRVRLQVSQLCALYVEESPQLRDRIAERMHREREQLDLPEPVRDGHGVWTFAPARDQSVEIRRRRALTLPDYYEVAHLLVRRRLITEEDLGLLNKAVPQSE